MTTIRHVQQPSNGAVPRRRYAALPLTSVSIDDNFWTPRIETVHRRTIPFQYEQCRVTGRIDALRLAWQPGDEPVPHIFWESDVAKWLEAASYALETDANPELDALVDHVITLLAGAQQPDGYLNVYYTVVEPGKRWTDLRDAHELYCAGHLIEAGVAHWRATGKTALLDIVRRYADYIGQTFGNGPGQKPGYCGHEEIELALVKLAHATGEPKYLELSSFFVDERGREPFYFEREAAERGTPGFFGHAFPQREQERRAFREYNQSHAPVRQQDEVVGHSVRAMYLYSAMADLAAENGDSSLLEACERLWRHLTTRRMYVTGGIGTAARNEGFTSDYDLPNETAYAETCAAIGLVFWAQRMAALDCDARYTDVLERALYNGVLSGASLEGTHYFYENPLASSGAHHRQEWFGCACCPPNFARLLASLGHYLYAQSDDEAVVHLYAAGSARFVFDGRPTTLRVSGSYPWDGAIAMRVELDRPARFGLRLRIPEWCDGASLRVNGDTVELAGELERGYARVEREWGDGDTVELDLPMVVRRLYAHPSVAADAGRVALQRGPLIYCLEGVDNGPSLGALALPVDAELAARWEPDLLGGVVTLSGAAQQDQAADWTELYRAAAPAQAPATVTAVPYYAWDNREPGPMAVWLREA